MTMPVWLLFGVAALAAAPAHAEVKAATDAGFTLSHTHKVAATPDQVWAALVQPSRWWSKDHSWSGDAKNFSLDPQAGGCFCERWGVNSVEHARVVFAMPGQQLRLLGAFGPLQGEALAGALTFTLKGDGKATIITADYVVGGYARFPLRQIAPVVDGVIGAQVTGLAGLFPPAS
jgi:uncharacterized protein YndB with AHSA1/START domain